MTYHTLQEHHRTSSEDSGNG